MAAAPAMLKEEDYDELLKGAMEARKPGAYNAILSSVQSRLRSGAGTPAPSNTISDAPAGATPAGAAPAGAVPAGAAPAGDAPPGASAVSGIPNRLEGWAEGKLNKCSEDQLLACLAEHGLEPPQADVQDRSLYAKELLFKTFVPLSPHELNATRYVVCMHLV